MLILECSIRMYGVRVDKKSCVYSEEEEIGHFRLGSRCVKKKKKRSHTKEMPNEPNKYKRWKRYLYLEELKKDLFSFLSFCSFLIFFFFCIEIPWSGLFVCFLPLYTFVYLYTPTFLIPILPISLLRIGIWIFFFFFLSFSTLFKEVKRKRRSEEKRKKKKRENCPCATNPPPRSFLPGTLFSFPPTFSPTLLGYSLLTSRMRKSERTSDIDIYIST